jgi:hypothetical protein
VRGQLRGLGCDAPLLRHVRLGAGGPRGIGGGLRTAEHPIDAPGALEVLEVPPDCRHRDPEPPGQVLGTSGLLLAQQIDERTVTPVAEDL